MDRLAAGILIAVAAIAMNGGMIRDAFAEDLSSCAQTRIEQPNVRSSSAGYELRSGRVLSLLVCLEALRHLPSVLDSAKV